MRIAIVGGTGKEGRGLGIRWARAGHVVVIGSRDGDKARERAAELAAAGHGAFEGTDNLEAARSAEMVVLTVPYAAHAETLRAIIDNGLLVLPSGARSIRFRPHLDLTAGEADTGLEILRRSLKQL